MRRIETQRISGSRWYVDLDSGERAPSVTSIIGMKAKPFLQDWAARQTAELAVRSAHMLPAMAAEDPNGAIDYLKGAAKRYTRGRADVGSRAHDVFERQIRGLSVRPDPDIEVYARHFAEFLDFVQPELVSAEDIAWAPEAGYAGSYDAILRVRLDESGHPDPAGGQQATVVADWKTSKSVYPDVALQLAAYRNAPERVTADGEAGPMPPTDGAFVLHVTPERWEFRPVVTSDAVFRSFLALRTVFDWDRDISGTVIKRPVAKGGGFTTGTERRV